MRVSEEYSCRSNKENLLEYLLIKAAPVMLQIKPSVLVRLTNCHRAEEMQRYDIFCVHQREILEALKLNYLIMKNNGTDIQVMFYDREVLDKVLADRGVRNFLGDFGYGDFSRTGQYLNRLRQRFQSGNFPHEIGIFLGYPLKDVKGFIEKRENSISVPRGLWRIFGDPGESLQTMWKYHFAEDIGRYAIEKYQDLELCIEKLRNAVLTHRQIII